MNRDDGGPAFPTPALEIHYPDGSGMASSQVDGMSLRDYFAGQALAGILANQEAIKSALKEMGGIGPAIKLLAPSAYVAADELLEARER